jgi:Circularly permutated YpsA SLOG family
MSSVQSTPTEAPLWKVISGGQIGADIAGLRAAQKYGLETGGWMPRGFRTKHGPRPQYEKLYGMKQTTSVSYPPRTRQNALHSDATIRFAYNFNSYGERATLREVLLAKKPYCDIDLRLPRKFSPTDLGCWLYDFNVGVLNVAGNADTKVEDWIENFLLETFDALLGLRVGIA